MIAWRKDIGAVVMNQDTLYFAMYAEYVYVCRRAWKEVWLIDGTRP